MLAELVDHVIGIDPDRDWITAGIIDAMTTGVLATERFPANSNGYDEALTWAGSLTIEGERAWAIQGTASSTGATSPQRSRAGEG